MCSGKSGRRRRSFIMYRIYRCRRETVRGSVLSSVRRRLRSLWCAGRIITRLFSPICVLATPSDKAVPYFGGGMQYGPAALDVPQGLSAEKRVNCRLQKRCSSWPFPKGLRLLLRSFAKAILSFERAGEGHARPTLPRSEERRAKAFCVAFLVIRLL